MIRTLSKRGFTLIELLVVIAIIGILASVVLAGLGSQRERAREAAALSSARSVVPVAQVCKDGDADIVAPDPTDGSGNDDVCADVTVVDDVWPTLPTGWDYANIVNEADGVDDFDFEITDGTVTFLCEPSGCTRQ